MPVPRTLRTATLLFALIPLAASAHADTTADARKAVQTAYSRESAAVMKKDIKSMFAAYAPDFVQTSPQGQAMTMAQIKQMAPQLMAMAKNIKDKIVIEKFSVKGSHATATVDRRTELTMLNPQTHQPAKIVLTAKSEDTWLKNGKGWTLKKSKEFADAQTVNGKPVPMPQ
jgi:ketosteroid isomerase-like protein